MSTSLDNRIVAGTILVAGVSSIAIFKYLKNKKKGLPTSWRQVGVLSELASYPIKSCGAVNLEMAECTTLGLKFGWQRDRSFMIVRPDGNFITAREFPSLIAVQVKFAGDKLTLSHPTMSSVEVNLSQVAKVEPETCFVWSSPVPVRDCGPEVGGWFSRYLFGDNGEKLRLVQYAKDESVRPVREKSKGFKLLKPADVGALPDAAAYMIASKASLDDLNARLGNGKVSLHQLRGNFLINNSSKAYEEDDYKWIKIGSNIFEVVQPCTRCLMTNVDADTGVPNADREPLNTLQKYRQIEDPALRKFVGSSPAMGTFIALRSAPCVIHLNDPIYVA